MELDERIQKFRTLCEKSSFPHKQDLVEGIESGKYGLHQRFGFSVPSKQMLNIYSARASSLERRISTNEINGIHPERLLRDVESLVTELTGLSDEKIDCWTWSIDESSSYTAFEGINSKRILGCILTVDKRAVSENEWKELWEKSDEIRN